MKIIHDSAELRTDRPSVVSIGKFDGFHLGHQKILREAAACRNEGDILVLFTFSRSPQAMITGIDGGSLMTREEQYAMAEKLGVDILVEYPFTEKTRSITAEEFLERILLRELGMKTLVAGTDCRFGYQRRGTVEFLEAHRRDRYEVRVVEKERWREEIISSTRIRQTLRDGRPEDAAAMLGYPFGYRGEVLHGRALGRELGFPTINLAIGPEKVVARRGVYASWVTIGGKTHKSISNVGIKPTISGGNAAGVETYIFDFEGDVYGETAVVGLEHFVRPEKKFSSVEELKKQVERDKETVRKYWRCST